ITSPYSTEKANFSHNGKFAFTVSVVQTNGGPAFRSIQIWNTTTGTSVAPEIVLANRSNRWAVSDDGHRLAVVSDTNVQFWDIQSRTALTPVITNRFPVN